MKDRKGSLSVPTTRPFNETAFYCQWKMEPPEEILPFRNETGITMTLKVSGIIGDTRQATRNCLFYQQYVRVTGLLFLHFELDLNRTFQNPLLIQEIKIMVVLFNSSKLFL